MAKTIGVAFERHGAGEPLMLIHGTGGSRTHWKPIVELLAQQRDLLLIDLPGHGESDPPAATIPHTPIAYARQLTRLLDALGIEAVHAVGNSVGGWTALELAKLGRARSVVALSPAGLWPKRDPWRCVGQLWSQHKLARLAAPVTPHLLRSDLGRSLLLRGTMAKPKNIPPAAAIEMATIYAHTPSFNAHLAATRRERFHDGHHITVPVTVAWGEKERLIPPKARLRHELPKHTTFITLAGCGHLPMWDDPELIARTILQGTSMPGSSTAAA